MSVIKLDSNLSFTDTLNVANAGNKTLRQAVLETQMQLSDPRLDKTMVKDSMYSRFNDNGISQFAVNGFAALDYTLRNPITNTFSSRDMPILYGGGALEVDKGFYRSNALNSGRLATGKNNKVNLVDVKLGTVEAPIEALTYGIGIGQVDLMKADHIQWDIIGHNVEAVRESYNIDKDIYAYVGHKQQGVALTPNDGVARGLLNQDGVTTVTLTKAFEDMNIEELVATFVDIILKQAESVAYVVDKLMNKLLVYPELWKVLVQPAKITSGATVYYSNIDYLRAQINQTAQVLGAPAIMIEMLPYLSPYNAANSPFEQVLYEGGTYGKVVGYRQDPYVIRQRVALDLTGGALLFDVANNMWRRNFITFLGTPLCFYPETIVYIPNIAKAS